MVNLSEKWGYFSGSRATPTLIGCIESPSDATSEMGFRATNRTLEIGRYEERDGRSPAEPRPPLPSTDSKR